ncbi:MAG TPA: YdcF family protein [Verrucomicrobiae bacterium]|nr:YdcF family protein [Verrucomicrobiae bacterium]
MTEAQIDDQAKIIWEYMQLHEQPVKSDAVFALGSANREVAEWAAELFLGGYGDWLIFSGGSGRVSQDIFTGPEAAAFARVAEGMGVPRNKIIVEDKATNTGENIIFTYRLLQQKGLHLTSFVLVHAPHMERRTFATFKKLWPDKSARITVTSPQKSYEDYCGAARSKTGVINVLVGNLQRIREYPKRGLQIEQKIPSKVWAAYEKLIAAGFDKYLVSE